MQVGKQKDTVIIAISYCISLFVTLLQSKLASGAAIFRADALLKRGWNISNIKEGYQKWGNQERGGDFRSLLLFLVKLSKLSVKWKYRKTKQMYDLYGEFVPFLSRFIFTTK